MNRIIIPHTQVSTLVSRLDSENPWDMLLIDEIASRINLSIPTPPFHMEIWTPSHPDRYGKVFDIQLIVQERVTFIDTIVIFVG